jgi:hypothetical protein
MGSLLGRSRLFLAQDIVELQYLSIDHMADPGDVFFSP